LLETLTGRGLSSEAAGSGEAGFDPRPLKPGNPEAIRDVLTDLEASVVV